MNDGDAETAPDSIEGRGRRKNWEPAYRIETARAVLRCWQPHDADLLLRAITQSIGHLQEWMAWAVGEPTTLEEKRAQLRRWRAAFDLDEEYIYGIFSLDEKAVFGSTGLHKRLAGDGLEIGYWIHVDQINRGLATETSAALSKVAFAIHQVDRVEIHCDPANVRSAAIPRKLGFRQEAVLRRRMAGVDGLPRDLMIWTLFREEYQGRPVADAPITAYDVTGRELPLS